MGYAQYLRDLLSPLGVYDLSGSSFSGGQVEALGAALDDMWAAAQEAQRESIPMTAVGLGLERWEALFPRRAAAEDAAGRRTSIGGFLSISGDSFTIGALSRCLAACGVVCRVAETETPGTVAVSFPEVMGEPEGFAAIREIAEEILPCHLAVEYRLQWCTWGQAAGLTWGDVAGWAWRQLETYRP